MGANNFQPNNILPFPHYKARRLDKSDITFLLELISQTGASVNIFTISGSEASHFAYEITEFLMNKGVSIKKCIVDGINNPVPNGLTIQKNARGNYIISIGRNCGNTEPNILYKSIKQ